MRELTLTAISTPTLKINGHAFELTMSDAEIMGLANEMRKKYAAMNAKETTTDEIMEAVQELAGCIDLILGKGAVKKISGGKPVSLMTGLKWLGDIASAAMEEYADQMAEMHG